MKPLLQPALGLMHRLPLGAKFALVGGLLLLPTAASQLMAANVLPADSAQVVVGTSLCLGIYLLLGLHAATRESAANLLATVRQLSEGDLGARAPSSGGDALDQVARRLNEMARENGRLIGEVRGAADEVANAATELATAAANVVSGTDTQSRLADSAASALAQMQASIGGVTSCARNSEASAAEAQELAREGNAVAAAARDEMDQMADSIGRLARQVNSLGERSTAIGGIVATIREIAEQTNLLALNAAIEAARAGESGRGFSVVADEVRKLAERTTVATRDIGTVISGIRDDIALAVAGMDDSRQRAERGLHLTQQAATALGHIRDGASNTLAEVQAIASASDEQQRASQRTAETMSEIASCSRQNLATSKEAAAIAGHLAHLADSLRRSAGHFSV